MNAMRLGIPARFRKAKMPYFATIKFMRDGEEWECGDCFESKRGRNQWVHRVNPILNGHEVELYEKHDREPVMIQEG